jgi:Replication initiator protein, pSAM2
MSQLAPLRCPAEKCPARSHARRLQGQGSPPQHLGYAGRRVLVSRKWSGKTLADHRADRKNWLLATLGKTATDPARYAWEPVAPGDPDYMEHARRLLHVVADRQQWHAALAEARRRAGLQPGPDLSATGRAA